LLYSLNLKPRLKDLKVYFLNLSILNINVPISWAMAVKEKELQNTLIRDLQSKGINVVNLRGGTFDLIVEGTRPYVCDLKRISSGLRGFPEDEKGFKFTKEQTKEILKMKFPPFAVAFDNDDYYFLPPDWVKREVEDLKEFNTAIMMLNIRPFPPAKTYAEILKEIVVFVTSNI